MSNKFKKMNFASLLSSFVLLINICVPQSIYASSTELVDINFGELLKLQEQNGYAPFAGTNMLENFYQAKAELPAEVPVLSPFEAVGTNIYFVSVDGDDTGAGSEDSPLKTIEEALNRVSEQKGNSIIYLREGEYDVSDTIDITSSHANDDYSLFIGAYSDEEVVFCAEENIALSLAKKVTPENTKLVTYERINENALGNLYYIGYDDIGLDKIPYETAFNLGDMPLYVSRYPNQGTDTVVNVIKDGSFKNGEGFIRTGLPMEWKPGDMHPFTWKDTKNIHIFGRVANEWSFTDGIVWFDKAKKTVKTTSAITPNYSPITTNFWSSIPSTYYYTNIFEELDTFGEWFADDTEQRFYLYLPEDFNFEDKVINYTKYDGYVFNMDGCSNVVIDNIGIKHANGGFDIKNSERVVLQNMKVNDIENIAVNMYNTEKCGILNSDIRDVGGAHTVEISQSAERNSELVPRRNFIQNTYIGNVSTALKLSGSTGNIISHNLIENTSYSAIILNGAENIVEYNEFSGVVNKITDNGGIYVGGDINNRANTIRYNYFHDSLPDKKNGRAIYNDDCSDMSWNYGNVIRNFSYGLFQHSGDDHVIMDNVVIDASTYIRNSADYATQKTLMENYFFSNEPQFLDGYKNNNIANSDTWQTRYRGILNKKYNQVLEARGFYKKDPAGSYEKIYNVVTGKKKASDYSNSEEVQKMCDLVADTGCYYTGNRYIVPLIGGYSNGYGPSDCGLYNVCEPNNNGKPKVSYLSSIFGGSIESEIANLVANMGLVSLNNHNTEKPVIYMEPKKEILKEEFTGIGWSETSNGSYYTFEISDSSSFKNILISYNTSSNEYPVYTYSYDSKTGTNVKNKTNNYEFTVDKPYFARVKCVSLANCIDSENIYSEPVEFILRNNIENTNSGDSKVNSYFGNTSLKIKLEGMLPDYLINESDKQITLMMVDKADNGSGTDVIKHIAQINPEEDGSFSYTFGADVTSTTRIKVRAGMDDITEKLFLESTNRIAEVSFKWETGETSVKDVLTAVANINNMFGVTDNFRIAIASYDEDGNLIGCVMTDSVSVEHGKSADLSKTYSIPENADSVKAFLWSGTDMKPLADAI